MIIPIRCFTCGKVVADKYDYYIEQVNKIEKDNKKEEGIVVGVASSSKAPIYVKETKKDKFFDTIHTGEILNKIGLTRYCCRRHMISTVDMMDTI
jgi:DNA-directed RNA polymerase I, II, and III subunit RPABC5